MVQTILFAKQKERHRHREQAYGHKEWKRGGGIGRLELIHTCVHISMYIYIFTIDTMYNIDS